MAAKSNSPPETGKVVGSDKVVEPHEEHALRNNGPWWLYPVVLAGAIAIVALLAERTSQPPSDETDQISAWTPAEAVPGESVKLSIDFGNGAQRIFERLPWQKDMTVADLMLAAQEFRPSIQFQVEGHDEMAFLNSLEGVANGGAKRRNWLYRVNGEHAHVSYAAYTLKAGDEVVWIYDHGQGE